MARAIATRCCSPPLNLTGGRDALFAIPTTSRNSMAVFIDWSQSCFLRIRGIATFSTVLSFGKRW